MHRPAVRPRRHLRHRRLVSCATLACAVMLGAACSGGSSSSTDTSSPSTSNAPSTTAASSDSGAPDSIPSIQTFVDNPSDQLPVDLLLARSGHPFKGKNAKTPHQGAHINFGTAYEEWPQGGDAPSNYPPIYAVADGVVSRVVDTLAVGENDRYGIYLTIAADGSAPIDFEYSLEPMAKEPSPGFYASFIAVKVGDRVKRGDVIGYMYLPKGVDDSHIHFSLLNTATGEFMAPAIFSGPTVANFYGTWKEQGFDSTEGYSDPIPICIGWKVDASENPYENRAEECLAVPGTQVG